jgi:hypothetical protein
MITILDAIDDETLFAPWFADRATWRAWRSCLCALFALPMGPEELQTFRDCTGRTDPPIAPASEAWLCCGRRAGKSFTLAVIAVFLACFKDLRSKLAPGERGTVMVIAADRRQARVIFRYIRGLITGVPMLANMIEREGAEVLELNNSISIEVGTASFRSVRGYALAAALVDEIAFLKTDEDAASPDEEVLTALRPGLATTGGLLLCASSPYARKGALWDAWRRHYAQNADPVLFWQAPTRVMNPTVPQSVVDDALEKDPATASAEFLAVFRIDVENLINVEAVRACIRSDASEKLPNLRNRYSAFVDPSGGSSDSFTFAIAHREADTSVLDLTREWKPPFSPEGVVEEIVALCRKYRLTKVRGDRYAGQFCAEQFQKRGIHYEPADRTKSELYLDLVPLINSGAVDLLRNERIVQQLIALERRTTRGGRDTVDHGPGGHDDLANAVAGALCYVPAAARLDRPQGYVDHQGVAAYSPFARSGPKESRRSLFDRMPR